MSDATEHYHLRWNNHLPNMLSVFKHLFERELFTDVTLWLDEGRANVKCHKIILVANSSFFEDIFSNMPSVEHPDVVLPQVSLTDFKPILDYIYRGEINIAQEGLKNLLTLANFLKVKGLVNEYDTDDYEAKIDAALSPTPDITTSTTSTAAQSSDHISVPHSTGDTYQINENVQPDLSHQQFSQPIWEYPGHPLDPESSFENTKTLVKEEHSAEESSIIQHVLRNYPEDGKIRRSDGCEQPYRPCSNESANGHRRRHSADLLRMGHNPYGVRVTQEDESGSGDQNRSTHQGLMRQNTAQNVESKKYKQYTHSDLQRALKAMEMGLSPIAAAKEFKVPSRTLYDKAKKMGINMRKIKRNLINNNSNSNNGHSSSAAFPYGIGQNFNGRIYRNSSESEYEEPNGIPTQRPSSFGMPATDHPSGSIIMGISGSSQSPEIRTSTPDATAEEDVQDLSIKNRFDNGGVIISTPKRELK